MRYLTNYLGEVHTYQEIVEIVEIIERVPVSESDGIGSSSLQPSASMDVDVLSDATDSDVDDDILSDGESDVDIGEYTRPDVGSSFGVKHPELHIPQESFPVDFLGLRT